MLLRRLHVLSILSPLADSPDLQKASAVVSFRTNCSNSLVDDAARFRQCDAARHRRQRMGGAVYTSEDTYRSSTDSVLQVEQSSTKRLPSKFRRCRVVQRNRVCGRHAGQEKEGSEERIDRDATTAHDPATVVTLDSREQQLHLNFIQHELVWSARSREYQQLLVRVVTCLESHLAPIEKCHTLLVLHEEVVQKRIRLRSDTYEDIFHTFHAVAMLGSAVPAIEAEEVNGRGAFGITSTSLLPPEFIGANVAAASLVSAPALQNLWTIYRYMIDSGTNPTARITQYVMAILERYPRKDPIVEARAHSLMMDIDRFRLTPTEYTVNSYIGVCDRNGVMHLAVARVTDYRTRHGRQPSAGMYARLLFGLVHNQQHKEALTCLATMSSVPITQHLLNATLLVARHSRDPLSAFSVYKSVMSRQSRTPGSFHMVPGAHTFSILLEAMWEAQCFGELDFLLREMQRYSVKGSQRTLNKLLRTLLELGRREEATTLCAAMGKKGMTVFDELKQKPHHCRQRAELMQWSAVEYDALLRFLANVGSQDPAVQRSNIVQLQHMAHWCAAPYALLDVLCGSERAPSLRQASGLVLKQLIQINPSLVQELNIKVMENTLLGALSDANTIVCRSASLVVAAIVNGGDRFEDRWPGLLQMLRDRASEMHRRSVQGGDPGAIDEAVRHISGVASCARIICEECGLTLRELVTSNEGMCACFFELFCHLLHAAAAVVFNEGDPNRLSLVVESVLSSVTCCITEAVFCVDETEMDEFPHHEGTMQIPQHVLSGALAVHRTACAFIHHAFAVSSGHTLLACIVGYLNCVLQWSKFGWDCTLLAVEEVLPHVLRRMCTGGAEDEQILVLCLNFITNVASCSAATLSHVAKGVAAAIFHCGAVACLLAESFSDECISRVPYTEANLRPLTPGERASILDSGLEEGMDDISSDASQSSETATSLQQSLVHTIEVMSNTCYDDLVGYLIPLITPAMVPGNHPDAQPLRSQETALFLFTELADELFEGLNSELVLSIAAYCWEVLSSNPLPPVNLRRHAVRCVARMATGCAANSWNDDTACPNTLSISSVLRLVSGVVLGDPSHRIQVDGIRCVSMVLPYVFDKHKEGIDEDITVTSLFLVVQNLLSKLPSMSLEARSATYRCLSEIFSLTASRKERWLTTINELTMQTISLLGARAEHIAAELSCSKTQGSSVATALELIALLNATVDVVNSASEDILIQKVGPLVNLAATLLSFCTAQEDETVEGNPNTFRGLYGSDISTLVLDMLDACCSTLLSEEELLCGTEASAQKFLFLRNIMGVGGSGDSSRVLDLCFELLGKGGVREKEVELRRSSFAFMSSALFLCCGQAGTLLEMYRLCIAETACNPHAEKAISNAFLCLAKLFYHLLLEADTDTTSLFCASVSMQDFQPLQEALQLFLVTTSTRTNSYVKTNAFGCAVALAALHQVAYCRPNVAHELYPLLDFSLCAFFRGTEADTCDRYRALMLFALLVSCEREDQQAQQKEKWSLFLPTIGNVLESFERSAPATLTSEVARRWMDILGHAH